MDKKIIICGAGGSGKDHLRKKLEKKGYKSGILHTTRPKREYEIEGKDYYFIDNKTFQENIKNNNFLEYDEYNIGWFYGLTIEEFNNKNLFVVSLKSFIKYDESIKNNSFTIFLDIDEEIRRYRLSKRNDADNVDRRIESDKIDLNLLNIKDFDMIIKNENF